MTSLAPGSLQNTIREQGYVLGSWINSISPVIAEIMASCGFDFLTVDCEHSAASLPEAQQLFQAIRSGNPGCHPLVRLPSADNSLIARYLDAGAQGIIVPMVNNADMATRIVSAAKYPPQGTRGVGYARSNRYGMDIHQALKEDNGSTFICAQIEHIQGVKNLDAILQVPGLDGLMIGPYDLSASMGIAGQLNHPEMERVKQEFLSKCLAAGKVAGIHVVLPDTDQARKFISLGYGFIAYSLDITILAENAKSALAAIKASSGLK